VHAADGMQGGERERWGWRCGRGNSGGETNLDGERSSNLLLPPLFYSFKNKLISNKINDK
jgi:hypothetical protein